MPNIYGSSAQYHQITDVATVLGQHDQLGGWPPRLNWGFWTYAYEFRNFFHPYVGALIKQLNKTDVKGMLAPSFLATLHDPYAGADGYTPNPANNGFLATSNGTIGGINNVTSGTYNEVGVFGQLAF